MCVRGAFDLLRCTFWLSLSAWKWFRGSQSDIDSAAAAPEACFCSSDRRGDGTERGGRGRCCWCCDGDDDVLTFSRPPSLGSSLPRPARRSASGFPSVFPKLHWFWPLCLRGPGPLALAVTLRWQKNTESWQRCSWEHKAWGFCWQSLLFLGYCFVTFKEKRLFEEFVRLFFLPSSGD